MDNGGELRGQDRTSANCRASLGLDCMYISGAAKEHHGWQGGKVEASDKIERALRVIHHDLDEFIFVDLSVLI